MRTENIHHRGYRGHGGKTAMRFSYPPIPTDQARDLFCRERARSAVQAGAWVCSRSTEVETRNRRAVPCPREQRPRDEELIERDFAMEDVSARQPVRALEIERCDHLTPDDRGFESWCVGRNRPGDAIRSEERRV